MNQPKRVPRTTEPTNTITPTKRSKPNRPLELDEELLKQVAGGSPGVIIIN